MASKQAHFASVDNYIATFPREIQALLQELRRTIQSAAPDAEEKISYNMPAFFLKGSLVYFSAWKNHIGLYGNFNAHQTLKDEMALYVNEKGSLLFPYTKPLPLKLISEIVRYKVAENLEQANMPSAKK